MSESNSRKVVVTQRFFDPETIVYLRSHDCEVVIADLPPGQADGDVPRETLLKWLNGAAGWIVGHARVTRDLLRELPELQIVSRRGVGYERVDVAAIRDLGRVATIAAGGNDATVADQAVGLMLAGAPYFATYTLGAPGAVTTLFVFLVGPIIFTMPGWIRVSRRMDKRGAMIAATLVFLVGCVGLVATPAFGSAWAYACVFVIGVGYAGLQLLQYSMLADTIVADAMVSGTRRAGVLTGIWTAAETVIFALGALVLAGVLGAAGFVSSDLNHPVAQPDTALKMIQWGAPLIAAAFIAASILGISRYDLTVAAPVGARPPQVRSARVREGDLPRTFPGLIHARRLRRAMTLPGQWAGKRADVGGWRWRLPRPRRGRRRRACCKGRSSGGSSREGPGGVRDGRASRSDSPRATPPRPGSGLPPHRRHRGRRG